MGQAAALGMEVVLDLRTLVERAEARALHPD
jgi:hypothetical protein